MSELIGLHADEYAEGCVIASILYDPPLMDEVEPILPSHEAFVNRVYGDTYDSCLSIYARHGKFDLTMLNAEFRRRGYHPADGYDVRKIAEGLAYVHNWDVHAETVAKCWLVRKAWAAMADGQYRLKNDPDSVESILNATADEISVLTMGAGQSYVSSAGDISAEIEQSILSDQPDESIPTGFRTLDGWLRGGVRPGEVMVIGGRPGQGKTALGVCMALQASMSGYPSVVMSIEMSRKEIGRRMMAYLGCPMNANKRDEAAIREARQTLQDLPLDVVDLPGGELAKIRGYVRSKSRAGFRLFVLDYIQLVKTGKDSFEEYQRVTIASQSMKQIAREYGVAMLVLAQVNRDGGKKERPTMADLKGSGSLEQDADQIVLVHNPQSDDTDPELILAKHRNGQTGTVSVGYRAAMTKFEDKGEKRWTNEPETTW